MLGAAIAALALLGILLRPFRVNEAWFAAGGALALVVSGALAPALAGRALVRGIDVYLFLAGMMALAEFARSEGVFAWVAERALAAARGSQHRLLLLVYAAGVVTTALLSNDATIVVLTPAVIVALARTGVRVEPYVFACALVANAASTLLPIANPSNLLFFADGLPPLGAWFASFGLASLAAVALTYAALPLLFRGSLRAPLRIKPDAPADAPTPRRAAVLVLAAAAAVLVLTAARGGPIGAAAATLGIVAALVAALRDRGAPLAMARGIAWPVIALTAGLFVLVEALDAAGGRALPRELFAWATHVSGPVARLGIAFAAGAASNAVNNLPVGLALGKFVGAAHPPAAFTAAALIGVNFGPNFSANGSLATILWLAILRRAGVRISPLAYLKVGAIATPVALAAAALLAR